MHPAVRRLTELAPPPSGSRPRDWTSVDAELGTPLPEDYRQLAETYGGSYWDDYLYVLEPGCPNPHYDLIKWYREQSEILAEDWEFEEKPAQLQEEGSQLVPWGTTDNGEVLFWLVLPGEDPESWTVMVREARGDGWEHFRMGCTEFLTATLAGEIRSGILSSRYPLDEHKVHTLESPA